MGKLINSLNKAKELVSEILFPRFCFGCGKEGRYICPKCEIFLSEAPPSKNVFSLWEYEGLIEKMIHEIKFNGKYHLIDELVEKALTKIELKFPEKIIITFVPMFKKREKERGFNQSALIARKLGLVLPPRKHKPLQAVSLLKKVKDNRSQVGLNPKERIENVKGAFAFSEDMQDFLVDNVLLVDDVYTTGATMAECTRVLKKAGVKNVWGFTLARKLSL